MMQVFNQDTFRLFLGNPVPQRHEWGHEYRYIVSEKILAQYAPLLRDTLYSHHSSFDMCLEIAELGFPHLAQTLRQRNSGNPENPITRMGNLGEVLGIEYAQWILGFGTAHVFPKRFNPNPDQSMKGSDILALAEPSRAAHLLIGESKAAKNFDARSIRDAYDHLLSLRGTAAARMLRLIKEILRLSNRTTDVANVDRHMADAIPRQYMIVSITQSKPQSPFEVIPALYRQNPLPRLVGVHIQIQELRNAPAIADPGGTTWLSTLFEVE
jgi:hypothetical protein